MLSIRSTEDVESLLKMFITSSAMQLSLKLGLFYDLHDQPLSCIDLADRYSIPIHRMKTLLRLLEELNLVNQDKGLYLPTVVAKNTILDSYSRESWVFLANEAIQRYLIGHDLYHHIKHPLSVVKSQGLRFPSWFQNLNTDAKYAQNFTIMLYERHRKFAIDFANEYETKNVKRLLDIGGGSGVMSLALLAKNLELQCVVVDVENVCNIGREIAAKTEYKDRIEYVPIDFAEEDLPSNFDIILMCDAVGIPSKEFSHKLQNSLVDGGRVVFVSNVDYESDWFDYEGVEERFYKVNKDFMNSLSSSKFEKQTVQDFVSLLQKYGFQDICFQIMKNGGLIVQGFYSV